MAAGPMARERAEALLFWLSTASETCTPLVNQLTTQVFVSDGPRRLQLQALRFFKSCCTRDPLLPWKLLRDRQLFITSFLVPAVTRGYKTIVLDNNVQNPARLHAEAMDTALLLVLFLAREAKLYWYAAEALSSQWSLLAACLEQAALWYRDRYPLYEKTLKCCAAFVASFTPDMAKDAGSLLEKLAGPSGHPLLQNPPTTAMIVRLLKTISMPASSPAAGEVMYTDPKDTWAACLPTLQVGLLLGRSPANAVTELVQQSGVGTAIFAHLGRPELQELGCTRQLAGAILSMLMASVGKLNAESALEQLPSLLDLLSTSDSVGGAVTGIVANIAEQFPTEV